MIVLLYRPVASTNYASGWMNYYSQSENQRSEKMMLEEGHDYLLVSEFADNSWHDYINVRVSSSANILVVPNLPSSLSSSFSLCWFLLWLHGSVIVPFVPLFLYPVLVWYNYKTRVINS